MGNTLERPLDCKEVKQVNPKGSQSWIFIGRTDVEAEIPILWPPDVKTWLIRKDPDAGKDWRQEEKGMTEDEMIRQHHCLNGHEFEQAPGDGEGQGSLACCSPQGLKESDTIERLNKIAVGNRLITIFIGLFLLSSPYFWLVKLISITNVIIIIKSFFPVVVAPLNWINPTPQIWLGYQDQ